MLKSNRTEYFREFHARRRALCTAFAKDHGVPVAHVKMVDGQPALITPDEIAATRASRSRAVKQARQEERDKKLEYLRGSYQQQLWAAAKKRAADKGLEFSITPQDIDIPRKCPVFNVPFNVRNGGSKDGRPSLDRLDNSKGYTPDNIRVISWRANKIKNDASYDEIRQLYQWLTNEVLKVRRS